MMRTRRTWLLALALVSVLGYGGKALAVDAEYINRMRNANRLIAQGVPDQAAKVLEQVLAKHPDDLRASTTYVGVLIQMARLEDAETFLAHALERIPDKSALYQSRVKLREAQGKNREALEDVLLVMATDPEGSSWAFREAKLLLEDGMDPRETRKVVDAARKERPESVEFAVMAAVVAAFRAPAEDALRIMIDFDDRNSREGEAIFRFATEMQNMGDEGAALEAMLAAVERTPKATKRSRVLEMVAGIQERQGKYQDALASLGRIAEEREGSTAAGNALLRSAEIQQKYLDNPQAALALYDRIKDDPILGHYRPKMLLQMADCYVRLGEFENAADKYTEVIPEALDPEHAELAALRLGDVEFYRGNPDSAKTLYQNMAEAYPRSLYTDQAADRYIMLNKYRPVDTTVWGRLEWALLTGDSLEVDATAKTLIERDPTGELSAEALLAQAEIAVARGNPLGALGYLETLVADHKGDRRAPEALMRQGGILQEPLGRPQEALMRYEAVLTDYPNSVQAGDARRLVEALRRELKS